MILIQLKFKTHITIEEAQNREMYLIFNHMQGTIPTNPYIHHIPADNPDPVINQVVGGNIRRTTEYLQPTITPDGIRYWSTSRTVVSLDRLRDHIQNNDYRILCLPDPNNNQRDVVWHRINDSISILSAIQTFTRFLGNNVGQVSVRWIDVRGHPGMKCIFSINPI